MYEVYADKLENPFSTSASTYIFQYTEFQEIKIDCFDMRKIVVIWQIPILTPNIPLLIAFFPYFFIYVASQGFGSNKYTPRIYEKGLFLFRIYKGNRKYIKLSGFRKQCDYPIELWWITITFRGMWSLIMLCKSQFICWIHGAIHSIQ